jgi:hypothetical protein
MAKNFSEQISKGEVKVKHGSEEPKQATPF